MNKKILVLLVIIVVILVVVLFLVKQGEEKTVVSKENQILIDVVNGKKILINEANEEIYYNQVELPEGEIQELEKYAFVDLDKDGIQELVLLSDSEVGSYIILRYDNENVYAYVLGKRALVNLKADGSFFGSNGANYTEYFTMDFNKNKYQLKIEASYNGMDNQYQINGIDVTENEIMEYQKNWDEKQNVLWIEATNLKL